MYGDPAYPMREEILSPFKGSKLNQEELSFNQKMSMNRIAVEWLFGKILSLWSFVDYKKNQRLYLQPVGKHFKIAVLLTNIHTCIYGNQVSTMFNLDPPTLEQYLIAKDL